MKKRHLFILMVLGLLSVAIYLAFTTAPTPPSTTPTPTPTPTQAPTQTADNQAYLQIFETVWNTVDQTYFDPEFGGLDWQAVYDQYQPLVRTAPNEEVLYSLLNQMLFELNVSHAVVGPADQWPSAEPVVWGEGATGIDLRLLGNQVVITRVEPGSPAESSGLRPGYILTKIEGTAVEQILSEGSLTLAPPYNPPGQLNHLTRHLLGLIYGEPGTCVRLTYRDENSDLKEVCVERIQRQRVGVMEGVPLPPSYLEFESVILANAIGYIRFNTFHPDLLPDLTEAVAEMQETAGIIIDVRGNPGGDPSVAEQLAAQFLDGQSTLGSFQTRAGTFERTLFGNGVYSGLLVILVDATSFSASEYFSSGMQTIDRAVIIGQPTPGGATGMNVTQLPGDILLGYPVALLITPDGRVLEGAGVIPDIRVSLKQAQLIQGFDAQLEAAIQYISTHLP